MAATGKRFAQSVKLTAMSDKTGHRERLRERFAKSGFSGFHDYEVLEFLLTFIFRQGDVKPLAKELMLRVVCGSVPVE